VKRRPLRVAQATAPEGVTTPPPTANTPPPAEDRVSMSAPVTIPREAEPLMTRALAAYYVMGDETVQSLRSRGWEYGDIATAGNIAVRSRRPFAQIARSYEERRDWTAVARDVNMAPEQVYIATNSPRYVMIRPTPQEMERMQIARLEEAYQRTLEQYRQTIAQAAPPNPDGRLAEAPSAVTGTPQPNAAQPNAQPDAAVPPPAAQVPQPDPNAAPAPVTPDPTRITTNYQSAIITPVERVASARLELAPTTSSALLRRAVAHYYALNPATIRDLEAQGWSLADVLVAGNLAHRSEATFEEVVALRQGGEQWPGIAERIGVAGEEVFMPTMARRVESGDWRVLSEMQMRDSRERQPANERRDDRQPRNDTRDQPDNEPRNP
jgi:hypothetical protein